MDVLEHADAAYRVGSSHYARAQFVRHLVKNLSSSGVVLGPIFQGTGNLLCVPVKKPRALPQKLSGRYLASLKDRQFLILISAIHSGSSGILTGVTFAAPELRYPKHTKASADFSVVACALNDVLSAVHYTAFKPPFRRHSVLRLARAGLYDAFAVTKGTDVVNDIKGS